MPTLSPSDAVLIFLANQKQTGLASLSTTGSRYPFPVAPLLLQVVSDRLALASEHLRVGDELIFSRQFRSAISRHYYAMYHAGRAVTYAQHQGDDFEKHSILPRHLPGGLVDVAKREVELTNARLLRNCADYDPYPANQTEWESDARGLASTAANFVQECEDFALQNGHI